MFEADWEGVHNMVCEGSKQEERKKKGDKRSRKKKGKSAVKSFAKGLLTCEKAAGCELGIEQIVKKCI